MKILVVGTWRKHKAAPFMKEAEELGRLLAAGGHILISGGGEGISEIVVNSYNITIIILDYI